MERSALVTIKDLNDSQALKVKDVIIPNRSTMGTLSIELIDPVPINFDMLDPMESQ